MAMIKVTAGSTTSTKTKVVDSNTNIKLFLQEQNIATEGCSVSLDSVPLRNLDLTFEEAGAGEECFLFSIVNAKNA